MLNFFACLSTILDRYEPTSELCQEVLQGIKDSVVPRVMVLFWFLVSGFWFLVSGFWFMVQCSGLSWLEVVRHDNSLLIQS